MFRIADMTVMSKARDQIYFKSVWIEMFHILLIVCLWRGDDNGCFGMQICHCSQRSNMHTIRQYVL